jgi:hypothetical protein
MYVVATDVYLLSLLGNGSVNTFTQQGIHATIEVFLYSNFICKLYKYIQQIV